MKKNKQPTSHSFYSEKIINPLRAGDMTGACAIPPENHFTSARQLGWDQPQLGVETPST